MAIKHVRCINARGTGHRLEDGEVYTVNVHVLAGLDYKGRECAGYILAEFTFPYVWDMARFEDYVPEVEEPMTDADESTLVPEPASDADRRRPLSDSEAESAEERA